MSQDVQASTTAARPYGRGRSGRAALRYRCANAVLLLCVPLIDVVLLVTDGLVTDGRDRDASSFRCTARRRAPSRVTALARHP
ncbi:hypothetical protein OG897_28030 [Streptomyces sp. NBC_00237]|uniref:hypothetical protein n=1 Tax=Streptomyces sp. NBC_00237 TaxID=2975687 RepID=UPI002255CF04|nr:hypothetical protein [Streptomyces sp. NBC_00237]MCX5205294.1 hypothetical protein [Streptomyces sp. NBC_00237]